MAATELLHADITDSILGAFYAVFKELGGGFLESVYEASMEIDLLAADLKVQRQEQVSVFFRSHCVGKFIADMVINDLVAIEIKAVRAITPAHEAQLINVLKATSLEVGLILNFGSKPEFRRMIYSNSLKSFNHADETEK